MTFLHLSLLGSFQATLQGDSITQFRSDKIRALLAYLAVEADIPHRRETLAALLWPESANAMRNLRKSLHRLRQTLDGCQAGLSDALLTTTRQTIRLEAAAVILDVAQFEQSLAAARAHTHDALTNCHNCLERVELAAEIYRGDFLAGFSLRDAPGFEEWLLIKRENLHRQGMAAFRQLAIAYEAQGNFAQAEQNAARQIALEPWSEKARRQLMRALAGQGKRAQALAQYERCREILAAEIGVEPAQKTRALRDQISAAETEQPDTANALPLLRHFPRQFDQFVARETEITAVTRRILNPDCALLTLLGPGGIGKTRLSIQAARHLAARHAAIFRASFPDGCYFVPLADAANRDQLITAVGESLAITFLPAEPPEPQLLRCLAGQKALLLLDNFEQLTGEAGFIADLINHAPQLKLIVTSREPLNLQAEWRLPVSGLAYTSKTTANSHNHSDAAQLFLQTARRTHPAFQPDKAEWRHIDRICQLTQGMPLAIQLAAAWTNAANCAAIAAEIERNLDFLAAKTQDILPRHRSVRAVFAHSWQSLSPMEQEKLAQTAVFAGSFDLSAAATVLEGSVPALSALLDKSLLQRDENGRYRLHPLLRQFAAEKLAALKEKACQTAGRHSAYYLNFIAAQKNSLLQAESNGNWLAAQREADNIRHAWEWAASHSRWTLLVRAAESVSLFYQLRGLFQEGETLLAKAAASAQTNNQPLSILNILRVQQIRFLLEQQRFNETAQLAEKASQTCRQTGQEQELSAALADWGIACWRLNDYEQAAALLTESLALAEKQNDQRQMAYILHHLGNVTMTQGATNKTQHLLQRALALYEITGNQRGLANILNDFASLAMLNSDLEAAKTYYSRSVSLHKKLGNAPGLIMPAGNLGYLYLVSGDYEKAEEPFAEVTLLTQQYGLKAMYIWQCVNSGHLALMRENYAAAARHYQQALVSNTSNTTKREALLGMAAVIAAVDTPANAARLLPATQKTDSLLSPLEEKLRNNLLAALRAALSDNEWQAAMALGEAMTLNEAASWANSLMKNNILYQSCV